LPALGVAEALATPLPVPILSRFPQALAQATLSASQAK